MILVFTGNGKGKTTAALGQAIRALGQNKKVLMVQFIKGPWISGEDKFLKAMSGKRQATKIKIIKTGKGFIKILGDKLPINEHKKSAQKGLELAKKAIKSKKYDLVILDEVNNAVDLKLIKASDVLKILKPVRVIQRLPRHWQGESPRKSAITDVILTGRNAPKSFIKISDLVTEMKEIKHPFNKNKRSMKKGMEY